MAEGIAAAPRQAVPDPARSPTPPQSPSPVPVAEGEIVPQGEFEAALPSLSGDINAPLEPMAGFDAPAASQTGGPAATPPPTAQAGADTAETLPDATVPEATELAQPLPPLNSFDVTPVEVAGVEDERAVEIKYEVVVHGLDEVDATNQFNGLSALEEGDGEAANVAQVTARSREDEQLALRIMHAQGYYDGTALSTIEQVPNGGGLRVVLNATPGRQYKLASVTIKSDPTTPPGLIDQALPLKVGDPIQAERIQGAEANVSLKLPQQGYPFIEVGERDILLDDAAVTGDYTLPVTLGPRASFGGYTTEGDLAFDAEHVGTLARFERGELYDNRKVDDLRGALVATGLFSSVSVEPQRTGEPGPDGTELVNLLVRQDAGPARTLAAEAGYGTGQGLRVEGSWTHRNLFPPEGALIVSAVAGTQEQGAGVTFRRQNAGRRDRTFSLIANANRSNYDAFEAFTGTLGARVSYDSTPLWQKRFTYAYGIELIGTNEDTFDYDLGERQRRTYGIAALPLFGGFDTSDNLLNPTKGFRIKMNLSPEGAVSGGVRPYGRAILEGTAYMPLGNSIVIAGRARAGTIQGIERDDLAPSRRFYAGGGGSVRGFGYQELGPRTPEVDDEGNNLLRPAGGRSFNEFALEARYRFGNFGIVPFIDAGQVYEDTLPTASDMRFGVGIGGRFYTNFGPFRVDVATPLNRREGESRIALYISIGQAF